ncbi:MAG: hypothetical protein K0S66_3280 [Sphingomonas sp.]|jgi:hypothetical protein|nr:hypothetical protein [Sphingomonas sp.]
MLIADVIAAWHERQMTQINLIVAADEPAIFFASVTDAERWMEPIDVADGVYSAAFGPAGEPHTISTDGTSVLIHGTGDAPQPEALKALMLRYLAAIGETVSDDISLPALLDRCSRNFG